VTYIPTAVWNFVKDKTNYIPQSYRTIENGGNYATVEFCCYGLAFERRPSLTIHVAVRCEEIDTIQNGVFTCYVTYSNLTMGEEEELTCHLFTFCTLARLEEHIDHFFDNVLRGFFLNDLPIDWVKEGF